MKAVIVKPAFGLLVGLIGMAIILAGGCGTPGKNVPVTEGTAVPDQSGVQILNVQVNNFYYNPSRIVIEVNRPVRLIMKNTSHIVPHNISIHAPDAGIDINRNLGPRKRITVEFTPTKTGEYPFFCAKDGHANKGMTGTLVVIPAK
jgi:plastocyanin domain-containing protein